MIAAYVTSDPAVLGRLNLFVAIIAGAILVDIAIVAAITRDRRAHRRHEAAVNARLARRYGKTQDPIAAAARRLLELEEEDEL